MKKFLRVLYAIILFLILVGFSGTKAQAKTLFSDTMTEENTEDWTEARNFQWLSPSQKCENNYVPAVWEYGVAGAGMSVQSAPCLATLATKKLELFHVPNYTMEFQMKTMMPMQADRSFSFRWIDAKNYYGVQISGEHVEVFKVVDGLAYSLPDAGMQFPFVSNGSYDVRVQVNEDHSIFLKIADKELRIIDSPPYLRGGGIAIQAGVGADDTSYTLYKMIEVHAPDEDFVLEVPNILQTNEAWKNQEYDSATAWAKDPSIGRWGCALTSATMILWHHGYTELPDHTSLTPASLNAWLKIQKDGFIGKGFLNWMAISRLTGIIKKITPEKGALEYSRSAFMPELIKNKITATEPVILEIPGHFVTATGMTQKNIVINDPLNRHNTLLADTKKSARGARFFHPSHTDLSGIVFGVPVGIQTQVWLNGIPYDGERTIPDSEEQEEIQMFELLQLSEGDTLKISAKSSLSHQFHIPVHSYAEDGTVSTEVFALNPSEEMTRSWNFQKTDGALIPKTQESNWEHRVREAKTNHSFEKESSFRISLHLAIQIDKQQSTESRKRYLRRLRKHVLTAGNVEMNQRTSWLTRIEEELHEQNGTGGP